MKLATTILIFLSIAINTHAQQQVSNNFFINIGGDVHLNKRDVVNETQGNAPLSASNNLGTRLGMEYYHKTKSGLFISTGFDYKYIPQRVILDYNSGQMGFSNTNTAYHYEYVFNNHNIDPYFKLGYSMPLKDSSRSIDYSVGAAVSIPLNGEYGGDETIALNITDSEYTDAAMFYHSNWGNISDATIPVNILLLLQLSYKTNVSGRRVQAGINLSAGTSRYINRTTINYFDANRRSAGTSVFADLNQSAGLFIGVGL